MREEVLGALHRGLAADAIHTLLQRGRDMPLDEAFSGALTETPRLSAALLRGCDRFGAARFGPARADRG